MAQKPAEDFPAGIIATMLGLDSSDNGVTEAAATFTPNAGEYFYYTGAATAGTAAAGVSDVLAGSDTLKPVVASALSAVTTPYAVTSSAGALAINWTDGNGLFRTLTTSENITSFSFTNLPTFATARLLVIGGGSHTITFPSGYAIFPYATTLAVTSAKRRLLSFEYNGTTKEIFVSAEGAIIP